MALARVGRFGALSWTNGAARGLRGWTSVLPGLNGKTPPLGNGDNVRCHNSQSMLSAHIHCGQPQARTLLLAAEPEAAMARGGMSPLHGRLHEHESIEKIMENELQHIHTCNLLQSTWDGLLCDARTAKNIISIEDTVDLHLIDGYVIENGIHNYVHVLHNQQNNSIKCISSKINDAHATSSREGGNSWNPARSYGCAQQSHCLLWAAIAIATAAALASMASYASCADEDMNLNNYPIRAIYGAGLLHLPGPAEAIAQLNAGNIQLDTMVVQQGGVKSDIGNVLEYDLRGAGDFFTTDGPHCEQPPADLAEWWALATFGHVGLNQVLYN